MKHGAVSVIIPCFNCQATIAETLASVAAQTLPPKEVILVDDGSSDRTWELLHELRQGQYPHLMLLSHPGHENHGASMARALGVAHASGEYIAFLDADDLYAPKKLERQLEAFERDPEIVMCHTAVQVIGDLDQAAFYEAALSGSPESPYWFRRQKDYLIRNRICLSSSLVRADVLNQVPFSFVGKQGVEDWLCWSLLAGKGRFLYLPEQLTFYHVHRDSVTSRITQSSIQTKSVAALWEIRLRKLYAGLEFKMVLLARSDRFLHSLRVMGSIAEDLRLILIAYLWNPGSNSDSNATLQPNALVKLLMLPFRLARCWAGRVGAAWFRR
ncbi:glycosyltransferase family 2 protein [Cyanobium sp. Cruz CV13-4-11]|jgi:glycosyltransferase involved in cell wall biosynthesis|uniref:glycosyltransferase family 2 protein n=1 Tax=unclassified Cyanobium TaxID=2627006 RepID=UPI0020CC4AFE|nr:MULTISPECIES: glycosyltransferase family 2 protein [unclassified Cyanobium]MCP9902284.1 glycosyltransferase family 2 protein [Cyanobium sp. Cruz CV11-17]MCP9921148.1 glycosyltransferase family 2 protein [Cyanobium sp. Cruz CV13-4-11]